MIKISNLNFSFDDKLILNNINLTVKRGQLVGLIGANGSGKTTLLKCMIGLYPTKHAVYLDDNPIEYYTYKKRAKKIALMHQSEMINFDFSCFDVVALGRFAYLGSFGTLSANDRQVITQQMQVTGTTEFSKRAITQLSGGERQRIMFAKTLVQESPFLLLDEPSSTLDIKHEREIFEMAIKLAANNFGIMMSIHNIRLAAKYCQRLILLSGGKIIADGSPEQVITRQNLKTAYDVEAKVFYNQKAQQIDFTID